MIWGVRVYIINRRVTRNNIDDRPHLRYFMDDDMGSKQVCTEVLVDVQTISKYSRVGRTVDSDAARKTLFYH